MQVDLESSLYTHAFQLVLSCSGSYDDNFFKQVIWAASWQNPTKWYVCPAKTQISLGIHPVWSESSLCTQWLAEDPVFLHADSADSDQTGRMPRLIWVFAGSEDHFIGFIVRWLICWFITLFFIFKKNPSFSSDTRVNKFCFTYNSKDYLSEVDRAETAEKEEKDAEKLFLTGNPEDVGIVEIIERVKKPEQLPVFYSGGFRVLKSLILTSMHLYYGMDKDYYLLDKD